MNKLSCSADCLHKQGRRSGAYERSIKHKPLSTQLSPASSFSFPFFFLVSFQIAQDYCLMHRFTKQGATESRWTLCGDVRAILLVWTRCLRVRTFPCRNFQRCRRFILEFLKRLPGSCWCFQGNCVIGKGGLNGGCQRGKLSAATGIHFTLWEFMLNVGQS